MKFDTAHLTSLFENATEGIIVTDSKGTIILINPSACRMFDYETAEIVDQKIEVLIPSSYRKAHVKLREDFYHDPRNRVMGHNRDLRGEKKGGENFPVEVSLSTYMRENERYVIAFIIDITTRKSIEQSMLDQQRQLEKVTGDMRKLNAELEVKVEERTTILKEALQRLEQSQEELNEALDKEKQLSEIKSRFVSLASHEFRTPLSTILSSVSLIAKYAGNEDLEKRDRHIEKIKGSVKHLNALLEDFLSLGKLNEGKISAVFIKFNLHDLVEEMLEEMTALVKKGQQLFYEHSGDKFIESDPKLIRNVLINLITNAIKFSGENSPIFIAVSVTEAMVTVSIKDSGMGISEEDQAHLFASFFRGKNAVNIQGTGLGLHIIKGYVDLLKGDIHLKSELDKGTDVTLTLPIKHN